MDKQITDKIETRQHYNELIVEELKRAVKEHPELRIGQILYSKNILQCERDIFYDEPSDIFSRMNRDELQYRQILLSDAVQTDKLDGKIVEGVALTKSQVQDENTFVMTFKDGTFIALSVAEDAMYGVCALRNARFGTAASYVGTKINVSDDGIRENSFITALERLHIINVGDESVMNAAKRVLDATHEKEYGEYLRLKEIFENEQNNKDDEDRKDS